MSSKALRTLNVHMAKNVGKDKKAYNIVLGYESK